MFGTDLENPILVEQVIGLVGGPAIDAPTGLTTGLGGSSHADRLGRGPEPPGEALPVAPGAEELDQVPVNRRRVGDESYASWIALASCAGWDV